MASLSAGMEAFCGKFGGGKSYCATLEAVQHFLKGGTVCGNLALNWQAIKLYALLVHRVVLRDEQWIPIKDSEIPVFNRFIKASDDKAFPVLVVLDECAIFFRSDCFKLLSAEVKSFIPQPRKFGIRLILIIQNFDRLVKDLRENVALRHQFRDMSKIEMEGISLHLSLFGMDLLPYFIHSVYDYRDKPDSKLATPMSNKWLRKDKKIFGCYDSFHVHGAAGEIESVGRYELRKLTLVQWLILKLASRFGSLSKVPTETLLKNV